MKQIQLRTSHQQVGCFVKDVQMQQKVLIDLMVLRWLHLQLRFFSLMAVLLLLPLVVVVVEREEEQQL
jgi:hypothetical protein